MSESPKKIYKFVNGKVSDGNGTTYPFDPTGLVIKIAKSNGGSTEVAYSDENKDDFKFERDTVDEKTFSINFTYKNYKNSLFCNINIQTASLTTGTMSGFKSIYSGEEKINLGSCELSLDPFDGYCSMISATDENVKTELKKDDSDEPLSDLNFDGDGAYTLTFKYTLEDFVLTASLPLYYSQSPLSLQSIEVTPPTKTVYWANSRESFDPTGIKVMACYEGEIKRDVTPYSTWYDESTDGPPSFNGDDTNPKIIEVKYEENGVEKTETFTLTVKPDQITELISATLPEINTFVIGTDNDTFIELLLFITIIAYIIIINIDVLFLHYFFYFAESV